MVRKKQNSKDSTVPIDFAQPAALSTDFLRTFNSSADVGFYICDFYTGEILMCNKVYAGIFGKKAEEMTGQYCFHNLGYDSRCPFCPYEKLIDEKGEPTETYTWENHIKKLNLWLQSTNWAFRWIDGRLVHMVTYVNVSQRRQLEKDLNFLAFYDRTLQIPNSLCLEHDLLLNLPHKYLVVLDIQGLKKINYAYGRDCGNTLLKAFRDYILEMNIPDSTLYRLEISIFGILLKETSSVTSARQIAEKLHDRFKRVWTLDIGELSQNFFVSANICVVPADKNNEISFNNLYSIVKYTLVVSRKIGGIAIYDKELHKKLSKKIKLELSLEKAVRNNMEGFYVVYQPIVESGIALWSGIEVLCRWDSPEFGSVSPEEFISAAESCGLIRTISLWILEQSIMQTKNWELDLVDRFLLEINLSPTLLVSPDLDQIILEMLKKYQYPFKKLCLEVTESSELNFSSNTMEAIERLYDAGVIIALDDFGTGYSSFNSLHKLPVHLLKTDRSFIADIESDNYLQQLFYVMVELAHISNMKIIVEGVETEIQSQILLDQGADYFQGYFFSPPLPCTKMEQELHNFHISSEILVPLSYVKLDLSRSNEPSLHYTPSMNIILNQCMNELLTNPDSDSAIDMVLNYIGQNLHISRSYIFLKETDDTYSITNKWCCLDIPLEKELFRHIPIEQLYPQWISTLKRNGIIAADIRMLKKEIYEILDQQGIKSAVYLPIWKDNKIYGFIGFDECQTIHIWKREEIRILHTLTHIITSTLEKIWLQKEIIFQVRSQENAITKLKNSQTKWKTLAATDTITSTMNRSAFIETVTHLLKFSNTNNTAMTLAFIDIDGLKKENDTKGHAAGDILISSVVKVLRSSIREDDIIGRYGGDEFLIAFCRCTKEYAKMRMQEALIKLNNPTKEGAGQCSFSFSYGLVENTEIPYNSSDDYVNQLIDIADQRMFKQKRQKKLPQ